MQLEPRLPETEAQREYRLSLSPPEHQPQGVCIRGEPCDCGKKHWRMTGSQELPSDSAMWFYRCSLCGHRFDVYHEG